MSGHGGTEPGQTGKLIAAAAWVHAHRAYAGRRLREAHRGRDIENEPAVQNSLPCATCGGRTGDEHCAACGGAGWVAGDPDPEFAKPSADLPEELAAEVGEFLSAWSAIERLGAAGWMVSAGIDGRRVRVAAEFWLAHAEFVAELSRLEMESDVARAIEEAEERQAKR